MRVVYFESMLASVASDSLVKIWNTTNWSLIQTHTQTAVQGFSFINSDTVASSGNDGLIHIWSISTGLTIININNPYCTRCLQLINSSLIASGDDNAKVKIWNLNTGFLLTTLSGHTGNLHDLAIVNPSTLASSSGDALVKIWDLNYVHP
jgi:WD40 repeat protein